MAVDAFQRYVRASKRIWCYCEHRTAVFSLILPMGRSQRLTAKRKFHGNRYGQSQSSDRPAKKVRPQSCASSSKIDLNGSFEATADNDNVLGYRLVDLGILFGFLKEHLVCAHCDNHASMCISELVESRIGLCSEIFLKCTACPFEAKVRTSSSLKERPHMYDVNGRFAYALRAIGKGHDAGELVTAILDLPPPVSNFQTYIEALSTATSIVAEDSMTNAAREVKEILCEDTTEQATVTVDGTWMKRGYSSKYGVVTVMSADNGKVLDRSVLSKHCQACARGETRQHKCTANYNGPSGGMEPAGAVHIFNRSVTKHGLKYTSYIGDGDSRAYKAVCESKPYDENIQKLECVGHIQKRLGSRMRSMKKRMKGTKLDDGLSLGGKGRLTDQRIDSLQFYYGKAIRDNTKDAQAMKKAVWATFFHKTSTDDSPQHGLCPKGEDSWCGYNRSLVTGEDYVHKNSIPRAVMEAIKPIYRDLADPALLSRCLHGRTQNANEALNQMIWARCPKTTFGSFKTVQTAVDDAIACYNDGNLSRIKVLKQLGATPGPLCVSTLTSIDSKRIRKSDYKLTDEAKQHRKDKRNKEKGYSDADQEKDYNPGMF